jgi:hypothetical protein
VADTPPLVTAFVDRLGDRVRLSDRGKQVEALRLRPELAASPLFEPAVRRRVEQLGGFEHPNFSKVLHVGRLSPPDGRLVIVSQAFDGWRLSEVLEAADRMRQPVHLNAVIFLLRQLLGAVSSLHDVALGVSHGALGTERLVATPGGRLVVMESVFGGALRHLPQTSPDRLWHELRLAVADGEAQPFGRLTDLRQIGVVGLSLALGRQLRRDEPPSRLAGVIKELPRIRSERGADPCAPSLCDWLVHVLSLAGDAVSWSLAEAERELGRIVESETGLAFEPTGFDELLEKVDGYYAADVEPEEEPVPAPPPARLTESRPATATAVATPAREADQRESHAAAPTGDALRPAPVVERVEVQSVEVERIEAQQAEVPSVEVDRIAVEPVEVPSVEVERIDVQSVEVERIDAGSIELQPVEVESVEADSIPIHQASGRTADLPLPEPSKDPEDLRTVDGLHLEAADSTPADLPEAPVGARPSEAPLLERVEPEPAYLSSVHETAAEKAVTPKPPSVAAHVAPAAPPAALSPASRLAPKPGARSVDPGYFQSPQNSPAVVLADAVVPLAASIRREAATEQPPADVDRWHRAASSPPSATRARPLFGVDLASDDPPVAERSGRKRVGLLVGLGAAAIVVIAAIGYPMLRAKPLTAAAMTDSRQPGTTRAADVPPAPAPPAPAPPAAAASGTAAPQPPAAPGAPPMGIVEVVSPVALDVLEAGRVLGASGQPLRLPIGRHTLEVVRDELGYRAALEVDVKDGRREQLRPSLPSGQANLNATPWAEVFIDGRSLGETPLGNVLLTIGTHEVTMRHPELGEQTRTLVVTTGAVARLSLDLRK